MADRRRLRHHLGRAALAWLSRAPVPPRAPRPPGRSRGRGAVLCFASFSTVLAQSCFLSC
ncbi:hypothetical protein DF107_00240 [Burkholderia stagnalis]|uniref:Uncharacterized protein n=1 Tax=Burkholderia stagnalis TaxID=1503054 RepID=A0A3N7WBR6_9BURK|nr:hypothetical protein F7R25_00260 [Burkholderia stagnalis]RQQ03058.1 hypothetical protein DF164_24705 [Burkholderia stagnalis]RQQ11518.1 hypothetical protein DF161_23630 [Burkholderia stagnalis]RQQ32246.1 hypothetical protein DF149_14685 [Burkholderia stagnalis]RQQ32363.1 hypothetical protein DF163_10285 [Burkholderia stagnalis]